MLTDSSMYAPVLIGLRCKSEDLRWSFCTATVEGKGAPILGVGGGKHAAHADLWVQLGSSWAANACAEGLGLLEQRMGFAEFRV